MIQKAVFSFWTKPNADIWKQDRWLYPDYAWYSWVVAVNCAKQWFDKVELVTDQAGGNILTEWLGLKFDSVRTDLEELSIDNNFWSYGKIKAYQIQEEPFIHLDFDVFLFKSLPENLLKSKIIVQNIEDTLYFEKWYQNYVDIISEFPKLPKCWSDKVKHASCMGVFGVNDLSIIDTYYHQVNELLFSSENSVYWNTIQNKESYCIIFEQFLLDCVAKDLNIDINYLNETYNPKRFRELGYLHIMGYKNDQGYYERIRHVVENNFPKQAKIIKNKFA